MQQKSLLAALLSAVVLPCAAQAETATLDEVVVTATRSAQSLNKSLADSTVLTEQAIRQSGAPDVVTLLRNLAGVEIAQSGGVGSNSSVFMRGTNSSHVLVLLDGVRISSATTGTTALEHLLPSQLARIEVVRGNVSSLYGSEAIGGVIQLFTKAGKGAPAPYGSVGVGSLGTRQLSAGFGGSVENTRFNISAGTHQTDGLSAVNPALAPKANPNRNGDQRNSFSAQVQHAFNADHQLSARVISVRGNNSYDNAFGVATELNNLVTTQESMALVADSQFTQNWHSQLRVAQGLDSNHAYKNAAPSFFFQTRNNQLSWQNDVQLLDGHRLQLAAERQDLQLASDTKYSQSKRKINSLLAGYVGEWGAHQMQLNVRQDRYSDMGNANSGLLRYGWQISDDWRMFASVGTGFKAPTFADMYYPLTWGYAGNPNLRPERATSREVGLQYAAGGQKVKLVYFQQRIRDLIASNNTFTMVINVGQAQSDGMELQYNGNFDRTRINANLTLQNPRDALTGQPLLRRSKESASVNVSHDFGNWQGGATLRHSGNRRDGDIVTYAALTLPAYQVLDLNLSYPLDAHLSVVGRVDNLLNKGYMQVHGFNTLGRTLYLGLNYQP